jgi:hypothetical protein
MSRASLVQGQLLCNGREKILYVLSSLGRGLEKEETGFTGIRLSVGGRNGALVGLLGD